MGTNVTLDEWRCGHCRRERPPLLQLAELPPGTATLAECLRPGVVIKIKCRQCKTWDSLKSTAVAA